jgi:predicted RNA-binding protein (virulence factor B family)
MELGRINKLTIVRPTDYGYFLEDEEGNEVLLPNAYVTEDLKMQQEIEVFIYNDSEDRITATTLIPYVQLEEFAYLQVKEVNKFGAFMDWGLPKDLLVPFSEQKRKMEKGEWHLIFMLKDEMTDRLIGSAKINNYLYFDDIDVKQGDEVDLLLYNKTDLGINAIVNNMYKGLIFRSDIHKDIKPGEIIKGYVKKIREDGKLDLSLNPIGFRQSIDKNTAVLLDALKANDGFLELTDKSSPDDINRILGLSKKAFKRAVGNLYKQKTVTLSANGIRLNK